MSGGTASYAPERGAIVWKLKQLPGGKEYTLKAQYNLPSVRTGKQPSPMTQTLTVLCRGDGEETTPFGQI